MSKNTRWSPEDLRKKGLVEKDGIYVPVKSLVNTGKVEKLPSLIEQMKPLLDDIDKTNMKIRTEVNKLPSAAGLDNEIKWKEPGEHAYDGSTINRTELDSAPFEVPFFKSAIHTDVDKYSFPNVTPEQAKAIGDIQRRKLSKANKSFGEAVVKAEQERAANPDKPYVHWEAPRFETIHLVILGEPKAQKRHRSVNMGKFIQQYDPSAKDKENLLLIVQSRAPKEPLNCPINLKVDFYFTRPKAHFKTGKNAHMLKDNCPVWHLSKPDADNCFKMISDALNKVFWRDDSLICQVTVNKLYDLNPRIEIFITQLA